MSDESSETRSGGCRSDWIHRCRASMSDTPAYIYPIHLSEPFFTPERPIERPNGKTLWPYILEELCLNSQIKVDLRFSAAP